jgi:hypothetical protein
VSALPGLQRVVTIVIGEREHVAPMLDRRRSRTAISASP